MKKVYVINCLTKEKRGDYTFNSIYGVCFNKLENANAMLEKLYEKRLELEKEFDTIVNTKEGLQSRIIETSNRIFEYTIEGTVIVDNEE